jgi:predicted dehydrogenase
MIFALLGGHPDGTAFAVALAGTGRHRVAWCSERLPDHLHEALGSPTVARDAEEALADPQVEAVILASPLATRAELLRRALQSERHAFCVHPCGEKADTAHEAAMLAGDVRRAVVPLLPEGRHPAFRRLAEVVGPLRLLTLERSAPGEVLDNVGESDLALSVPGWDVLRAAGGEVAEVFALCGEDGLEAGRPVALTGRFGSGALFQVTLSPGRPSWWRLTALGGAGAAELTFPQGWDGPSILEWREGGERREEYREAWDPWPALVEQAELAMTPTGTPAAVTWSEETRCLELDEAARHSARYRRASLMEYAEASEEAGFKGTMALAGCALVWVMIGLLAASAWFPWAGWLILPLLAGFIGLQLLGYALPPRSQESPGGPEAPPPPSR